jgi:hypothetical protein
MLDAMADQVAEIWRPRFLELGHSRVEQAVKHRKGARFLEEVLLAAIVAERRTLANFIPQQHPGDAISKGQDIEPDAQMF